MVPATSKKTCEEQATAASKKHYEELKELFKNYRPKDKKNIDVNKKLKEIIKGCDELLEMEFERAKGLELMEEGLDNLNDTPIIESSPRKRSLVPLLLIASTFFFFLGTFVGAHFHNSRVFKWTNRSNTLPHKS